MNGYEIHLDSLRAKRARLGRKIGQGGIGLLWIVGMSLAIGGGYLYFYDNGPSRLFYLAEGFAIWSIISALWARYDLLVSKPSKKAPTFDNHLTTDLLSSLKAPITPKSAWQAATKAKEGRFITNRLMLPVEEIGNMLGDQEADMGGVWSLCEKLREGQTDPLINAGTLATALLLTSESVKANMNRINLQPEDVEEVHGWLNRLLDYFARPKPYFGGVGRDWAMGFTPNLEHFGQNLSSNIQAGRGHFHFLANLGVVDSLAHNLSQGASSVAIVGPTGVGKTELVNALAERLLSGQEKGLEHYQVHSLNASLILSHEQGSKEKLLLTLFSEAIQAGNIILFLDEAQLFFGNGLGAIDLSQVLLPVLQSRRLKLIAAFTPNDFQRLKVANEALANSMAVININEPSAEDTRKVVEDAALTLEARTGLLITYEAIREAYRLSAQYLSDQAFPGKAINLLDQAVPYATNKVLTDDSVQMAIEKTMGVKPGKANAQEADVLLNLENKIHERMINQTQAVNAVAAALRRVRAGVTNPNRPAGSFLFLGPTGVGKTELARSLANAYFGDSTRMIRLDMSEYQRPDDVARLLEDGGDSAQSLIMSIRKQPFSVVLLDEIEKAHPNILNLMLQLLDEGQLTDAGGRAASFKSAIIITTSNAGSADIIARITAGESMSSFERPLIDKLIQSGQFRPELINRFDDVVLFRPLNQAELTQVAKLMIGEVNKNLSHQNITVSLTDEALNKIAAAGYDPQFGARPMRHLIQRTVEDVIATKILRGEASPGSTIVLDVNDMHLPNKEG
ncbi:MAG: AAA family ATPase [Candidatus Saccharibacteria bacterium]|nr:AAA family ATPase [Candidatus Saccharibacteria bacterium]